MKREDIPKLLAEVGRLHSENASLCPIGDLEVVTSLKVEKQHMAERISELQRDVERLKELAHEILEDYDRAVCRVIDEVSTDRSFDLKLQDAVILSYRNEINGVDV